MLTSTTYTLTVAGIGPVEVATTERGAGPVFLVLHGGAGPQSVAEFAGLLAEAEVGGGKGFGAQSARVITPTHPGFDGTARPDALNSVRGLAALYVALLDELDLTDVTVIGNSIGGWIAAEVGLLDSSRVARIVLVGATGVDVPDHPVADVSTLTPAEIFDLSYHDPEPFLVDVAALPPAAVAVAAGNRAALVTYGGASGADPSLLGRLSALKPATLVLWGASDRIVDPDYGRAYADAIPRAQFQILANTGHVPQVETPEELVGVIQRFVGSYPAWSGLHTANTTVARAEVWATLRDLYTGTALSDDGDTIEIHGPFAVGTTLSVTPHGANFVIACTITELADGKVYAYRAEFDGLFVTSRHSLTALASGGTRIAQHSTIAGPRAEELGPQIGPRITADHPRAMHDLIAAARSRAVVAR